MSRKSGDERTVRHDVQLSTPLIATLLGVPEITVKMLLATRKLPGRHISQVFAFAKE